MTRPEKRLADCIFSLNFGSEKLWWLVNKIASHQGMQLSFKGEIETISSKVIFISIVKGFFLLVQKKNLEKILNEIDLGLNCFKIISSTAEELQWGTQKKQKSGEITTLLCCIRSGPASNELISDKRCGLWHVRRFERSQSDSQILRC